MSNVEEFQLELVNPELERFISKKIFSLLLLVFFKFDLNYLNY